MSVVLAGLAAALLALAALHDVAVRTIPNWVAAALALVGLGLRLAAGDAGSALLAAGLVFALGVLAWRFGGLGGGDVKLLVAAALLPPPGSVPDLLLAVALCGGVLALATLVARALVRGRTGPRPRGIVARVLRAEAWRIRRRGPLPYAVAIAGGAFLTLTG